MTADSVERREMMFEPGWTVGERERESEKLGHQFFIYIAHSRRVFDTQTRNTERTANRK